VLELLKHGERTVGDIAKTLPISRPAVSQHLKVLLDADLVAQRSEGTRNYYRLERQGFDTIRAYVESFWHDVLTAYAEAAKGGKREQNDQSGSEGSPSAPER
jgi:DNA-binding transcriptional ArsR family regulator